MTTHSSVLAWRIPGMGEPGGLLSMRSHRVGHNSSDLAAAAAYKHTHTLGPRTLHTHTLGTHMQIFSQQETYMRGSINGTHILPSQA